MNFSGRYNLPMSPSIRRARRILLQAAFNHRLAVLIGSLLFTPAAVVSIGDYRWETWITDGICLVMASTGIAFVLAGLGGRRPDWIDTDDHQNGAAL